ncbi:MAG: molybdopterin synthase sulfur carrier subunit [Candidatus Promineifilaceae bacterium]|jgi:sulfur-carrier protein
MHTLSIHYYAALRDAAACPQETVNTTSRTPLELYAELRTRHGFQYDVADLKVAINDAFAPMTAALAQGDTVVFIPPVSGG